MKFKVHLTAFQRCDHQIRKVEVPENECTENTDIILERIYNYGQNETQPRKIRSVSVGDIIFYNDKYYLILFVGFKEISKKHMDEFKKLEHSEKMKFLMGMDIKNNNLEEPAEPQWDNTNPDESFRRYADYLHEKAKWTFLKDKTHVEIIFVFKSTGEGILLLVRGDRDAFVKKLKELIRNNDAVGVVHICEAWTRFGGNKDHLTKQIMLGEIGVSDLRPADRTEALFVSVQSVGQSSCWVDPIVRDAKTGEVSLGESVALDKTEGRFGGLFK